MALGEGARKARQPLSERSSNAYSQEAIELAVALVMQSRRAVAGPYVGSAASHFNDIALPVMHDVMRLVCHLGSKG